ncbi:MAG: hypothetical protein JRH11_08755 [Deltaproteobacteria bacterium]|nr:hypothetical protein [Deltaproteobacteria bacterium]
MTRANRPPAASDLILALTVPLTLSLSAVSLGCATDMVCGPGTVQIGNACIVDDVAAGGGDDAGPTAPPSPRADAGMTTAPPRTDPGSGSDAGTGSPEDDGGFSTIPPGTGGPRDGGPTGCTGTECDTWAEAIAAGVVAAQMAAGCGEAAIVDERIVPIAARHAAHQASLDRLTMNSPEGSLFTQVGAAAVDFRNIAALVSVSVDGPEDVLARWAAGADTAAILGRCDAALGVGVATGASGDSYVTVLMAHF